MSTWRGCVARAGGAGALVGVDHGAARAGRAHVRRGGAGGEQRRARLRREYRPLSLHYRAALLFLISYMQSMTLHKKPIKNMNIIKLFLTRNSYGRAMDLSPPKPAIRTPCFSTSFHPFSFLLTPLHFLPLPRTHTMLQIILWSSLCPHPTPSILPY